ncbi:hypothetical protein HAX54_015118, partial [Datura stramonium]|nr:hypothetical protein [Datura stramonium]
VRASQAPEELWLSSLAVQVPVGHQVQVIPPKAGRDIFLTGSAKHWELPGKELGTGTRRSENHLNRGIDCISSFVPHSNWGSKSTKFDDTKRKKAKRVVRNGKKDTTTLPLCLTVGANTVVSDQDQESIRIWIFTYHLVSNQDGHYARTWTDHDENGLIRNVM